MDIETIKGYLLLFIGVAFMVVFIIKFMLKK